MRKLLLVIAFENLEHKKMHQTNQLNCAGNTLFYFTIETASCEIIRPVYDREDKKTKPYPAGHSLIGHRRKYTPGTVRRKCREMLAVMVLKIAL